MKRSKKYLAVSQMFDIKKRYPLQEAIKLTKQSQITKFDATVECAFHLNLDPKKADQNLRGALVLPHGTGKTLKLAVIAKGEQAKIAKEAQADYVGDEDLIEKISKNWFDFDVLVSTPEMMPQLSKLGRLLGPKGLMPNPKTGTVTDNVGQAVSEIKNGKIEYRLDKNGNIHAIIGKTSFEEHKLLENLKTLYLQLMRIKPRTAKGNYIKNVTISTTMSPGIKIDPITIA
ncbi:50S ribosomal protein L1 [Candidatus Phytoplasma australiense]|uniref:Large ribosomal subunit protein uL1 n=1 Tax=Phytoplasma australiense TaxID=59748 RepID=RL1_PHYAS|nr:RecName: Full=Large ribosomal subunit protein uL1; AltName: Full=50S ribosomal protein L1 [Candidatus Phytoplasma australiense]CAM12002.1 50S ribosomal protein L1 [Candidatus Phytoplasma australiense]